ncbi:MAG TPA: histone deacetylase [bacterium]
MKIGIVRDKAYLGHRAEGYHPENPERLRAIYDWLDKYKDDSLVGLTPRIATEEEITMVHTPEYFREAKSTEGNAGIFDADTYYSPDSFRIALLAAGGAIVSADAVAGGRVNSAFAFLRPPGHHAETDRAMGFCIFNNAAIAASYLIHRHKMKKILIIDWDLHHGNGTQWAFYTNPSVLYFSTHQYPYYPGTGAIGEFGSGDGEGFNVNVPLPAGMINADYAETFKRILVPVAEEYSPEFVLVSAGFDAHRDDPLGGMKLTDAGFGYLAGIVKNLADKTAMGRLAFCLEGGYNLNALRESIRAVIEALKGKQFEPDGRPSSEVFSTIENVIKVHKRFWKRL